MVTELSERQRKRKVQLPFSESVILALHVSFSAKSPSHGLLSVPPWPLPIGWFAWKSIRIQGNGELQLLFTRMLRPWLSHSDPCLPSVCLSLSFLTLSPPFWQVDNKSLDQVSLLTKSCWFFGFSLKTYFNLCSLFPVFGADFTKLTLFWCRTVMSCNIQVLHLSHAVYSHWPCI